MAILLVPTDYSAAAANAARYAAQLAQQLSAEIHLLHIYQLPVGYGGIGMQPFDATFAPMPMLDIPMEDLKASAESGMTRFADALMTEYPNVRFKQEVQLGSAIESDIAEYANSIDPLLVIIGSHNLHGIENWGSHVTAITRGLDYPVLAVPEVSTNARISRAVLATDLQPPHPQQATTVATILGQLGASLQVVHVSHEASEEHLPQELQTAFASLHATFATIVNDNVTAGLKAHLETSSADLLIILPHHHNLWDRLFAKEHTSDILSGIPVPVLCLPEPK